MDRLIECLICFSVWMIHMAYQNSLNNILELELDNNTILDNGHSTKLLFK